MDSELTPQDPDRPSSPDSSTLLNGTLEDRTPAGVLQLLSAQKETGAVRFSGEKNCTVYLDNGELYFAETSETGEDLAIALVRPGRLTADEWDQSTASGYPTETVGEALIATGSISRDLLASVVLSVIYDPLVELFRAPEGDFEFEPGVVHWIGPYRSFSADAIVAEVRRRTREADEMVPVVPSLEAWVRSTRSLPSDRGSVNLRRDDWEVVIAAAAGRTVSDLAVDLGRGRWSTARLVYRLASVDLLEVTPGDNDPAAADIGPTAFAGDTFADSDHQSETSVPAPAFDDAASMPPDPFEHELHSLIDGPPPLDPADYAPDTSTSGTGEEPDEWAEKSWENAAWDPSQAAPSGADASTATPLDDSVDPWAAFDEIGTDAAPAPEPDTTDDPLSENATGWDSTPPTDWALKPTAPVADAPAFDATALHPDIAKALAESTYADSATAINAMAARLGAADADDDDDTDDDFAAVGHNAAGGEDTSAFWSNDNDEKSFPWDEQSGTPAAPEEFTWKPAVWDVGVETTPLPQREHAAIDPDAPSTGPAGSADPEWLESLYTQFMPTGDAQAPAGRGAPNSVEQAFGADPGAAPKAKTLRRLMSAIKRL